jgi:hypothetical protein
MPVLSNTITLAQYAMMSNDPLVKKISFSLLENGSVLNDIPLTNKKSLKASGVRFEGDLPTVTWAKLNDDWTAASGTPKPFEEQAFLIRNSIDVDKKLVEDENQIQDPRAVQLQAYLKSVVYDFNDKIINNDPITGDANAPTGLRYRLDNPNTYGVVSELKLNAGSLDMSPSGMTVGTANQFVELVQTMVDYLGGPDGVVFYMNDTLKRRFAAAIRLLGAGAGFDTTRDAFDRVVQSYQGAVVRDIGRKSDQSTRIITNTETSAGAAGSSTFTSFYAVKYGEDHLMGWQFEDLGDSVIDYGLLQQNPLYRIAIDYAIGLFPQHTRCMGRAYGIKVS